MSPLSPLLHSQHRTPVVIKQQQCAVYIILILFIMSLVGCLFRCLFKHKHTEAKPVLNIPPGAKLFTLDGREIRLHP